MNVLRGDRIIPISYRVLKMVATKPRFTALQRQGLLIVQTKNTNQSYISIYESIYKMVGIIGSFSILLVAQ